MKRFLLVLIIASLALMAGCNSGNETTKELNTPKEPGSTSVKEVKGNLEEELIKLNGELRTDLLPFAEHVNGQYNEIVRIKTPTTLSIENYEAADPNRNDPNKSLNTHLKGDYADVVGFDTIYTPQDAMKEFTELNLVPDHYTTYINKNLSNSLHIIAISLENDSDEYAYDLGVSSLVWPYEKMERYAAEKEWEDDLEEGESYNYDYGKGTAGDYEYYYSSIYRTFDEGLKMYRLQIYFKVSDKYFLRFEEDGSNAVSKGGSAIDLFIGEKAIDVQGYADYLATWIVPVQ